VSGFLNIKFGEAIFLGSEKRQFYFGVVSMTGSYMPPLIFAFMSRNVQILFIFSDIGDDENCDKLPITLQI